MKSIKNKLRNIKNEWDFPYRAYLDKNECVFIHIPKTAGSSVLKALGKKNEFARDHLPWYVYKNANPQKFERYFKFAFVRNPWTRTFSAYRYLLSGGNKITDKEVTELLFAFKSYDDFLVNGLAQGVLRNHPLFIPQSEFVIDYRGNLAVNYVGYFENLENDFSYISEQLGFHAPLAKLNMSHRSTITETVSEMGVEAIRYIYAQDFNMFGYSIEPNRSV